MGLFKKVIRVSISVSVLLRATLSRAEAVLSFPPLMGSLVKSVNWPW